jgi:hypothetical protein
MEEQLELIALIGQLMYVGSKMASELTTLTHAARECGSELQEAECFVDEWVELTSAIAQSETL